MKNLFFIPVLFLSVVASAQIQTLGVPGEVTTTPLLRITGNAGATPRALYTAPNGDVVPWKDTSAFFNGNYNNLFNKPVLFSGAYADLTGKPVLFDGNYNSLSNLPILFDGDYNSLFNRPTIPTDNLQIGNGRNFITAASAVVNLTTTGTAGAATWNIGTRTLNIPQYAGQTYTPGDGLLLSGNAFRVDSSKYATQFDIRGFYHDFTPVSDTSFTLDRPNGIRDTFKFSFPTPVVTEADPLYTADKALYELKSNKKQTGTLGTSQTIYPSEFVVSNAISNAVSNVQIAAPAGRIPFGNPTGTGITTSPNLYYDGNMFVTRADSTGPADKILFATAYGTVTGTGSRTRTFQTSRGLQTWFVRGESSERGSINFSTPRDFPGMFFTNALGKGRSQIRQLDSLGGLALGSTVSDTVPNRGVEMHIRTDGEVNIHTTTDWGDYHLQVGGNVWANGTITALYPHTPAIPDSIPVYKDGALRSKSIAEMQAIFGNGGGGSADGNNYPTGIDLSFNEATRELTAIITRSGLSSISDVLVIPAGSSGGTAGVSSFNGRTGAVTPQAGDYSSFFYPLSGNPSEFITAAALAPYELTSNKSTATALGTSNTLYPTQNAVKTYVDNAVAGVSGGGGFAITTQKIRLEDDVDFSGTVLDILSLSLSAGTYLVTGMVEVEMEGSNDGLANAGIHIGATASPEVAGIVFNNVGGTQPYKTYSIHLSTTITLTTAQTIRIQVNSPVAAVALSGPGTQLNAVKLSN